MIRNIRPGVFVEFTGNDGESIDGEILYSDDNLKFFLLQRPSKSGRHGLYDVHFFRHDNVKDMKIIRQRSSFLYPELDLEKVARRSLENEKKEIEKMKLFEPDVSAEVRELFEHLSKTLPGEANENVRWIKPDIHVFKHIIIKPPYSVESVQQNAELGQATSEREFVRKLVAKFHSDRNSIS